MRRLSERRLSVLLVAIAVAGVAMLGGCAVAGTGVGTPDPSLRGQWKLESGLDRSGLLDLSGSTVTLTIARNLRTTGRTTCGPYAADIFGTARQLSVDVAASTPSGCVTGNQSILQRQYLAALGSVRRATVGAGILNLSGPDVVLRFVRAQPVPMASIGTGAWELSAILTNLNTQELSVDAPPTATFRLDGAGHFSGTTGCRTFSGTYTTDAGQFVVTNGESSNSPCLGSPVPADEAVLAAFHGVFTIEPQDGMLDVVNQQVGIDLVYLRSP